MSRKNLFPDFFGSLEQDPLLETSSAEATSDASEDETAAPARRNAPSERERPGASPRRGYRLSPLFEPTETRRPAPQRPTSSPPPASSVSSETEEQRAFVVKQIRGRQSNVEELNRAIERGWRLVHIAPISRRPSPELVETDFAALITLRRPSS